MGTILLIAVTVALAAVVATLVGGLGTTTITPIATLTVSADLVDENNLNLTIDHQGGDAIPVDSVKLFVTSGTTTLYEDDLDLLTIENTFIVPHSYSLDSIDVTGKGLSEGGTIAVSLVYKPNNQVMSGSRDDVLLE